jgi:transcriptional regulator NrdR family protein
MGLEDYSGAKRKCDRCGRRFMIEDLSEDRATPGLFVCKEDNDLLGFNEAKAESPRDIKESPHFK